MASAIRRAAQLGLMGVLALTGSAAALATLGEVARETGDAWGDAYVLDDVDSLPAVEVALVLGTDLDDVSVGPTPPIGPLLLIEKRPSLSMVLRLPLFAVMRVPTTVQSELRPRFHIVVPC